MTLRVQWLSSKEPLAIDKIYPIACLLSAIALFLMLRYNQCFPKDDGAFFLRYADNIASGHGYRCNPGETNGIGASAPLWPPLIALFMAAGLPAFFAVKCLSVITCGLAFILLFSASMLYWGILSGPVLLAALAGSGLIFGEAMGGLETPLTLLLMGAAFFTLARDIRNPYIITLLCALLFIHKLDMLPWAAALALTSGLALRDRRTWYALAMSGTLILVYFAAMKLGTDHFFPVSLTHKFTQSWSGGISRWWFIDTAYWHYGRWAVAIPALLALPFFIRKRMAWFCCIGLAGQALAYSLFPPSEPFLWYACASMMGVNMLMAGIPAIAGRFTPYIVAILLCCGLYSTIAGETIRTLDINNADYTEADRARAGVWVAAHTPPSFRLATGYGNPAFYSHRYVYDYSGLNMAGPSDLPTIIDRFSPEIIILCPWKTAIRPETYFQPPNDKKIMYFGHRITPNYKAVKYFDSTLQSGYDDFYALILVRSDVEGELVP